MQKRKVQKILLVEPRYRNKYPPLGLMRIATAHKLKGDTVVFSKGIDHKISNTPFDAVYITTLFTFDWKITIDTIKHYAERQERVLVGGILASLMPDEVQAATGIRPHIGPLHNSFTLSEDDVYLDRNLAALQSEIASNGIDSFPPDYGIFEHVAVPYHDALAQSYFLRSSRGCHRGCRFCSVNIIEPRPIPRIPLRPYVDYISERWGQKQNLILLDDNVLESRHFDEIIDEICGLGFHRNAHFNGKRRSVDFNQGIDIRLLQRRHLEKLSSIELRPLRLAFDNIDLCETFVKKVDWAVQAGFREISTYVLYNYSDSPADLYERLSTACNLNEKYGIRIYSFPMKYVPSTPDGRAFLGPKWTRRQIRGLQCILNATHGISPTQPSFFRAAFGRNVTEFLKLLNMPEDYIIKRYSDKSSHPKLWEQSYKAMTPQERRTARLAISGGKGTFAFDHTNPRIAAFLSHYTGEYDL